MQTFVRPLRLCNRNPSLMQADSSSHHSTASLSTVAAAQFFQGRISFVDTFPDLDLTNADSQNYVTFADDVRIVVCGVCCL